jgi:hypothetical protein
MLHETHAFEKQESEPLARWPGKSASTFFIDSRNRLTVSFSGNHDFSKKSLQLAELQQP